MPVAKVYPLDKLIQAGKYYFDTQADGYIRVHAY